MPQPPRTTTTTGRRAELARIHIGAARLGLIHAGDDTLYRDMLWTIARVRSAKDLDAYGRGRVLDHLAASGHKHRAAGRRKGTPQSRLISLLWTRLGEAGHLEDPSERALRAWVRHQSEPYHPERTGYDAPELLPSRAASKVIEHLKAWCERVGVRT